MLFRRILPCQRRTQYMWEFDPAGPRNLQRFFGTTHEDIWKLLFKTQKSWPEKTEERGYDCARLATPVSFMITFICKSKEYIELSYSHRAGQRRRSRSNVWLRCPRTRPLPYWPRCWFWCRRRRPRRTRRPEVASVVKVVQTPCPKTPKPPPPMTKT